MLGVPFGRRRRTVIAHRFGNTWEKVSQSVPFAPTTLHMLVGCWNYAK